MNNLKSYCALPDYWNYENSLFISSYDVIFTVLLFYMKVDENAF